MMSEDALVDELRGSEPIMTSKSILLSLYHDMNIVRPAVERLMEAQLDTRVDALEQDRVIRDALGGTAPLVVRVAQLEASVTRNQNASQERSRLAGISNRVLAVIVVVVNLGIYLWSLIHPQ